MDFVREHLTAKRSVDLDGTQDVPNNIELEIMADTVYVRVRSKNYSNPVPKCFGGMLY